MRPPTPEELISAAQALDLERVRGQLLLPNVIAARPEFRQLLARAITIAETTLAGEQPRTARMRTVVSRLLELGIAIGFRVPLQRHLQTERAAAAGN